MLCCKRCWPPDRQQHPKVPDESDCYVDKHHPCVRIWPHQSWVSPKHPPLTLAYIEVNMATQKGSTVCRSSGRTPANVSAECGVVGVSGPFPPTAEPALR